MAFWDTLPSGTPPRERWESEEFRAELRAWCEDALGPLSTMEQVKLRSWSTVWRVTTPDGAWFAKQGCPLQNFEVPLVATLARLAPHHVIPVTRAGDGFLLTPDLGPTFRETTDESLGPWLRLTRAGAELQREVAPRLGELGAAGADVLAPGDAAAYVEARVDQLASLPADDPRRLDPDAAARVLALLPEVRRWADRVGALGLPITLNHNDLHENNVFHVDDTMRFFDFGDALLTEPLGVLMVPLNVLAHKEGGTPREDLLAVAEAGLEVWSDLAPMTELRGALPAAQRLACLYRAESWMRCLPALSVDELAEWGDSAAHWLRALLEEPPLP